MPAAQRRRSSVLGAFLRERRRRIHPWSVELAADHRRRRVEGLRREELAELAGISTDYYARLEQGRERQPSAQVLESLARALRLDDDERGHLFRIAGQAPRSVVPPSGPPGPDLRALLHPSLVHVPITVLDRTLDIVSLNPAAAGLYSGFARRDNLLRMVFCDPSAAEFYGGEWDLSARSAVASLRASWAQFPDERRIGEVAVELGECSESFASLWAAQEIRLSPCPGTHRLRHPVVGDLDMYCLTLANVSVPGQQLQVFIPEPGSETAQRVEHLESARPSLLG